VTHVLVDEVHERTVENDFLLLTLKSLLKQQHANRNGSEQGSGRPGGALHVCLMSESLVRACDAFGSLCVIPQLTAM